MQALAGQDALARRISGPSAASQGRSLTSLVTTRAFGTTPKLIRG